MKLAVFDVDGTLLSGMSTERGFALWLWRRRMLSIHGILEFLSFHLRWSFRFGRDVIKKNKAYLTGLRTDLIDEESARYVAAEILPRLRPELLTILRAHQAAGDMVVLLSGTLQPIASALGEALQVDRSIGSICTVDGGHFMAAPPLRHPFAESKSELVIELCGEFSIDLAEVFAYGDSIHDLHLLTIVGHPVAIYPDRKLGAEALRRNWQKIGPGNSTGAAPAADSVSR